MLHVIYFLVLSSTICCVFAINLNSKVQRCNSKSTFKVFSLNMINDSNDLESLKPHAGMKGYYVRPSRASKLYCEL